MAQANIDRLSRAEADALRKKDAGLRRSIVETVLTSTDVPDAEVIRKFRSDHAQRRKAVENGKRRVEQLAQAQADLKPLEDDLRAKHGAVSKAQASLQELHRPLGQAAFQGLLSGQFKDQGVFHERLALQERIDALRKEHAGLAPNAGAGAIEKAKATAQQLAVGGKIKLEEMKIGKLDSQIGQQLIEQDQEGSVRCSQTDQILGQIAERRRQIAALVEQEAIARNKLSAKATEVARTLNLSQVGSTESLNEELKRCRGSLAEAEQAQAKAERELPAMLLADSSIQPESTLGRRLSELRQTEERLEHVPASAVRGAVDRFRRPGIAIALLVVLCGGLALVSQWGHKSPMSKSEKVSFARKCIQAAEANPDLAVKMLEVKVTGPVPDWSDEEVADVLLALSEPERPVFGDLLKQCQERHQAEEREAKADLDKVLDEIRRDKERQHELEKVRASQTTGASHDGTQSDQGPHRAGWDAAYEEIQRENERQHELAKIRAAHSAGVGAAPVTEAADVQMPSGGWGTGRGGTQVDQGPHRAGWDAAYEDIQREKERQHELAKIRASQGAGGETSRMTKEEEQRVVQGIMVSPLVNRPEVQAAAKRLGQEAKAISARMDRGEVTKEEGYRLLEEAAGRHRKELVRIKSELEQ